MLKYLYYIYILFIGLIIKLINPIWYWVAVKYRTKARNIVYSYVVNNNIYLKELYKSGGYLYVDKNTNINYITYLWYKFVIWIWVYDNVNYDTFNRKDCWEYISNNVNKNGFFNKWMWSGISKIDYTYLMEGTSFLLGNRRNNNDCRNTQAEILHLYKNNDSNFDYLYFITDKITLLFYYKIFNYEFGWRPCDNTLGGIGYKICFFKPLIKEN